MTLKKKKKKKKKKKDDKDDDPIDINYLKRRKDLQNQND